MNFLKKALVGVGATVAMMASAYAAPINVGGVIWDPDASTDFSSQSINMRQFINSTTGELTGFGIITAFNGTDANTFCPGCELTFQFGGYMPVGGTLIPGVGQTVSYTGGWAKVYVGHGADRDVAAPTDYNSLTWANTGNGALFLDLVGNLLNGATLLGTASNDGGGNYSGLSGIGRFDVAGGIAAGNFDTNTQTNGSDLLFTTSLSFLRPDNRSILDTSGTGNFRGNTIPEPASLALAGLALLGLGAARRRKSAK